MGDELSTEPLATTAGPRPPSLPLGRHPRDLVALLLAAAVVALCAWVARGEGVNPVELAIYEQIERIPSASAAVWRVFSWAGSWPGIAVAGTVALYLKRVRLGLECVAAGAVGWVLAGVLNGLVGYRPVPLELFGLEGIRLPGPEGFPFPSSHTAVAAAMVSVAGPYLKARYRHLGWVLVVLVAAADVYLGYHLPVGVFAGAFLGWGVGAAFHLVLGAPGRQTSAAAVHQALARSGLAPEKIVQVRGHVLGPLQYTVTTATGDRLRVEVVRRLHRRAGPWYRLRRLLASLEVEDEPPLSSTYHEAEHEALVTLLAEHGGVRTPPIVLACQAPDGSSLLVRRQIEGRRLTRLGADEITDALLDSVWALVARLGEARIAHHDLRAKNFLVDDAATPWLLNLTLGKVGADTKRTTGDVAEALVSITSVAGVERAVASAARVLPAETLEAALTYLQPLALPRRIRKQLSDERYLLTDLRETLAERIDRPIPPFRSPVRPATVVGLLLFGGAIYTLLPQLASLRAVLESLNEASWTWLVITVVTGLVAIVFAAVSVIGSSLDRLPFWHTTAVQTAAAFTGRTTPGGVGFFGINVAFMERLGIRRSRAVGVAMLNIAGTGVLGGVWSVVGAFGVGTAGLLTGVSIPHTWPVVAAVAGVVAVAVAVLASPFGRRKVIRPALQMTRDLAATLRTPRRAVQLFGGAAAYLAVSGLGLVTSLAAFGAQAPVAAVLTVFVIGQTFGHIIPTPGGLGAVESLMVGGLAAIGTQPTIAVAAVLTSRLLTYWLPVLPGIAVFRYLQHHRII
ncbi:lysylphosphatidylglycerol synthase domain-containing protein [Amycolatopsis cynarae]|uniref:Lysylphosphatidylglycerol synthase domain-containing protein n=1 Tax=Amycolatopsis cynarae TaxID=2995223 RepID=A0ABY7AU17_9PSEU|nr:lysylphosphatidylglycerol synthase domain-containing protein [Amycolatopsis sp. HUAS 11-8]WAL63467.1 lysylphosphatidylglycerol synthase domain-containing protein [Amycolatopsis sp. HUAS 11-8]